MGMTPNGGSSVKMTYTPACGATTHAAYWGLADENGIGPGGPAWINSACGLGTSGTAIFDPGAPPLGKTFYFVIVGQISTVEGSYGRYSSGTERTEAAGLPVVCDVPQMLLGGCF